MYIEKKTIIRNVRKVNASRPDPDKEQKLNKFLFSYFIVVPQNVL